MQISLPTLSFDQTTTFESRVEMLVSVRIEDAKTKKVVWSQVSKGTSEFFLTQDLQFNRVLQNRALEQAGRFIAEDLASRFLLFQDTGELDKALKRPIKARCRFVRAMPNPERRDNLTASHVRMSVAVMSMELSQSLARSGVLPLYAVVGEEDYLRDQSIAILREAALGEALDSGFNYDVFHGDDSSIEDVLACAAEIPVFAARRVIVYKSVEKLPGARRREALVLSIGPERDDDADHRRP